MVKGPKLEGEAMPSGYKTALEVSIDVIKDDIADMKNVLKGLTTAVSTLAVQEERQTRMRQDIDAVLRSLDSQWKVIRTIQDTCKGREKYMDYAEKMMYHPDTQSWWNAKVTGVTEKLILIALGAIASALGYQLFQAITLLLQRK